MFASEGQIAWCTRVHDFYKPSTGLADAVRRSGSNAALSALGVRLAILDRLRLVQNLPASVHFVYLHHVFEDEEDAFRATLTRLRTIATPASHTTAARTVHSGDIDRTLVSISFDDGMKTCLKAACVMEDVGFVGCFFVCPAVVEHAANDAWVSRWCEQSIHKNAAQVMGWDDLEALQDRGHEIGNHTMHHVDLAKTSPAQRQEEIFKARDVLVRRLGASAGRHFAWPYGEPRHITQAAIDDVFAAGHVSCASAVRGAHIPSVPAASTILLRNHAVFTRPRRSTEVFVRRNLKTGAFAFPGPAA